MSKRWSKAQNMSLLHQRTHLQWRSLNAPIPIESTTPRICAQHATGKWVGTKMPQNVPTQTGFCILKACAKSATYLSISKTKRRWKGRRRESRYWKSSPYQCSKSKLIRQIKSKKLRLWLSKILSCSTWNMLTIRIPYLKIRSRSRAEAQKKAGRRIKGRRFANKSK